MTRRGLFFKVVVTFVMICMNGPLASEGRSPSATSDKIIIIDPGHGGKDPGAIGYKKVREKDVVLSIAKRLSGALAKKAGAQVFLTRNNDRFITLGERDRIANRRSCDLFLSVHANASKNKMARGLEIYYLNKATDEASRRLALRENEGDPRAEKEIDGILSDLIQTASTEESAELALQVRKSLQKRMPSQAAKVHVKTALFYVLVGAKCPSLLIETGFVTHPEEGKRLKQAAYQRKLAEAIAEGVQAYFASRGRPGSDL